MIGKSLRLDFEEYGAAAVFLQKRFLLSFGKGGCQLNGAFDAAGARLGVLNRRLSHAGGITGTEEHASAMRAASGHDCAQV